VDAPDGVSDVNGRDQPAIDTSLEIASGHNSYGSISMGSEQPSRTKP